MINDSRMRLMYKLVKLIRPNYPDMPFPESERNITLVIVREIRSHILGEDNDKQ